MTTIAGKMKDAGYKTAMTGKWDAGMATPQHTPLGRGFDSFYGYYQHANSYWNKGVGIQATGEIDLCLNKFIDLSIENSTYRGGELEPKALDASCDGGANGGDEKCYEEALFTQNTLSVLDKHDPSNPLFLFHSFHLIHTPLDVPASYIQKAEDRLAEGGFAFDDSGRQNYSAMVHYMDDVVGQLTDKLKSKGMWEDSVVVFLSDNGGPIYKPGSGNNHPLRGGKYSDFEGGIRTNAFVTGGHVPPASRGTKYSGITSIADWYGLFCDLAGVDPKDTAAEAANEWLEPRGLPLLPPVDAVEGLWGALTGTGDTGTSSLRSTLHQSDKTLIVWPYKLVLGSQPFGSWTGPMYPNCSGIDTLPMFQEFKVLDEELVVSTDAATVAKLSWVHDCGDRGCLFNIEDDPNEHDDLAAQTKLASKLKAMREQLGQLNEGNFEPHRGDMSADACAAGTRNGGYYGPFVGIEDYYTGPFPDAVTDPTPAQRAAVGAYTAEVGALAGDAALREGVVDVANRLYPEIGPQLFATMDWCLPKEEPAEAAAQAAQESFRHWLGRFAVGLEGVRQGEKGATVLGVFRKMEAEYKPKSNPQAPYQANPPQ